MGQLVWIAALVFVAWAGWLDWRSRRIPNRLTVSGLLVGLGLNAAAGGWNGLLTALLGAGVLLVLLLPLVLLRGLGAGDWKLMGALGAFLGPGQTLVVLLTTVFITGLMACLQITWRRRWRSSLANLGELMRGAFIFRLRPHPVISLDNPGMLTLPFGVAVAIAVPFCYVAAQTWGGC